MKRHIIWGILLLSSIFLVAETTTRAYTISFDRDKFYIVETDSTSIIMSNEYDIFFVEDTLKPAIPHVLINIYLPDGEVLEDFTYEVVSTETSEDVTLQSNPAIVSVSQIRSTSDSQSVNYKLQNYPITINVPDIGVSDEYKIAAFEIPIMSYDAISKIISWASEITLYLQTSRLDSTTETVHTPFHVGSVNSLFKHIVYNYTEMEFALNEVTYPINPIEYLIVKEQH